jgi:hypothetical protein
MQQVLGAMAIRPKKKALAREGGFEERYNLGISGYSAIKAVLVIAQTGRPEV